MELNSFFDLQSVPSGSSCRNLLVCFFENLRFNEFVLKFLDFLLGWPDIPQEDLFAVAIDPKWFLLEVNIDSGGESIGNDQRRGGQVVSSGGRMDSALEVPIPTQNGSHAQICLLDGILNLLPDFPGVSNTGHTPKPSDIEPHQIQVLSEAGEFEVLGDCLRTRRKRGLDVGWDLQLLFVGVFT